MRQSHTKSHTKTIRRYGGKRFDTDRLFLLVCGCARKTRKTSKLHGCGFVGREINPHHSKTRLACRQRRIVQANRLPNKQNRLPPSMHLPRCPLVAWLPPRAHYKRARNVAPCRRLSADCGEAAPRHFSSRETEKKARVTRVPTAPLLFPCFPALCRCPPASVPKGTTLAASHPTGHRGATAGGL